MRISDWSSDVCSSDLSRAPSGWAPERCRCSRRRRSPAPWPAVGRSRTSGAGAPDGRLYPIQSPDLPWGAPGLPVFSEKMLVAEGVEVLPEPVVPVGDQLALLGQCLVRLAFPGGLVAVDVVEHLGLEDEEAAVDVVAVGVRLLAEAAHTLFAGQAAEGREAARIERNKPHL